MSRSPTSSTARVVVIGAGLAGLVAARRLVAAGVDDIVVLEASDRVGGRTWNVGIAGASAEGGGEFAGVTQTAVLGLAAELGIETFATYDTGETTFIVDGAATTDLPLSTEEVAEYERAVAEIERLRATIDLEQPARTPDAHALDRQSVADLLDGIGVSAPAARGLVEVQLQGILGALLDEVSLLWFLYYVAAAGGWRVLGAVGGGAQELRFDGGSQRLCFEVAAALGDRIRTAAPVVAVRHANDGNHAGGSELAAPVVCDLPGGGRVGAEHLIVACSPADCRRIVFEPRLPPQVTRLVEGWPAHGSLKVNVAYDRPFWRADGRNGQVIAPGAPVPVVFDNSPRSGLPGILVAFPTGGPQVTAGDRRESVIETLTLAFGPAARKPIDYVETNWAAQPTIAGCVCPLPPGFFLTVCATLGRSIGRVHFAGAETSTVWNGYMDGAVRSGERAAADVLAVL